MDQLLHLRRVDAPIFSLHRPPDRAAAVDQLTVAFQPVVRWSDRAVHGYEALLRPRHPAPPDPRALIDAARRDGRLHDVGRRVRRWVAQAAARTSPGTLLFVNLHPAELLDEELLSPHGILTWHAHRCVLEITDPLSLSDVDDARERLQH